MQELYIGLMSGTSLDGIDTVITDCSDGKANLLYSHYSPYPETVRQKLKKLCNEEASLALAADMDVILGRLYAESVLRLLEKSTLNKNDIQAIGNHGQTIRHHPYPPNQFSLQIGDPNLIAEITGITTVADFRRRDIAAGGQGAPLVPIFHQAIFRSHEENRAIVNIGGIANITLLPCDHSEKVTGFDCGPGNALLDYWTEINTGSFFDKDGDWARTGQVNDSLLTVFCADPFFSVEPPKSTGTDYFSPSWLHSQLDQLDNDLAPEDVQATLTELTAQSIVSSITKISPKTYQLFICGGGAHNRYLMERITQLSGSYAQTSDTLGISPDWVEAMAFAWLARQTIKGLPGNLPEVTGAKKAVILGGVYKN